MKPFADLHPIPGYAPYTITRDGRIQGHRRGRWLRPNILPRSGLLRVQLCIAGIQTNMMVHRLVLRTFVGPCPDGHECRHLDGNPQNNSVENLAWGTHKENMQDRARHGRSPDISGEKNPNAKLTREQIEEIKSRRTEPRRALAAEFGISIGYVDRIRAGRSWIDGPKA